MKYYYLFILLAFFRSYYLYSDCIYKPNNNEGYLQIWNFEHHSNQYFLFVIFMISNQGKGDFNNGLTIYLKDKNQNKEYLKTLEYTNKKLHAIPNALDIQLENESFIIYKNNILSLNAHSGEKEPTFNLKLDIPIDINNPLNIQQDKFIIKQNEISYKILYLKPMNIHFSFDNKILQSFGAVGFECIYSKDDPLAIAKSFYFIRNFEPKNKIFIFYLNSRNDSPIGKIYYNNESLSLPDKYQLNTNNRFYLEFENCKIESSNLNYAGGFYVLNNVSLILRWFLKLIGIDPYIKHYRTSLYYDCNSNKNSFSLIQFSHIQLK